MGAGLIEQVAGSGELRDHSALAIPDASGLPRLGGGAGNVQTPAQFRLSSVSISSFC